MQNSPKKEDRQKWAQIFAKAWKDGKFKSRLLSHPNEVLKEFGIDVPVKKTFRIIEEKADEICVILPALPDKNLIESELKQIQGGVDWSWGESNNCCS